MNFFVESCKWNPQVRWRFYTDCGEPENHAGRHCANASWKIRQLGNQLHGPVLSQMIAYH
jgi:hypothetical protein